MPQLLYVLHNAPIWIPMFYFKKIICIFRALIWKKKFARIKLDSPQRDKFDGGWLSQNYGYIILLPNFNTL